jgi:TIR domain/SEFIR domain/Pentapeptide repeats (9 copies)
MGTLQAAVPVQRPVRVFISYSHDSSDHSARLLSLTQRLRREGVDATIDQFTPFPKEGWIRWMQRQLDEADFTLCVCTENYRIGFDGLREGPEGKGVNWEGQTIAQSIYDNRGNNSYYIPVIFAEEEMSDVIPRALRSYKHFILDRQYDELYFLLTNQPVVSPEPLGPIRQPSVISPGVPSIALPLDAADAIESLIRLIAAGPGEAAEAALAQLEQLAQSADDDIMAESIIRQLISYISALEASSTYPLDERLLRKKVIRMLIRLTGGKLNNYLPGRALSGIDLALFDFRGADMIGVEFSGSFMIECDFRGVNLSRSSFAGCYIRNTRFGGAVLHEVVFSDADWFNALGLDVSQLASSRTNTLMPSPLTEEEMVAFLDQNYAFKFRSWGRRIQEELRHAWATYLRPGGLAGEVARWAGTGERHKAEPALERTTDSSPSGVAEPRQEGVDFFVSYTSADLPWAEWIAWQLEEAGYWTAIQAWDSRPGNDFVRWMDQSIRSARHILVVLSPAYDAATSLAGPEWTVAIGRDPTGERAALIPVRVADFKPGGLLATRGCVDLVGKDEKAARDALLEGVRQQRLKPATQPPFPSYARESSLRAGQAAPQSPAPPPQPRFPGPDPLDRIPMAMRQLDEQAKRFKTYGPSTRARRVFLNYTFFPAVGRSLDKLTFVSPATWPDPGWAVDFSATRNLAVEKLSRAAASSDSEQSREIMELLYVLKQLREKVAMRYPELLDA